MSYDTYHLEPMSFEMCRKKSRAKLLFGKFMGTLGVIGVIYTRFGKCMGTIWGHKGSFIYGLGRTQMSLIYVNVLSPLKTLRYTEILKCGPERDWVGGNLVIFLLKKSQLYRWH